MHVALIRGINVGKAKRVAMGDLRALIAKLGYGDPRTLLNSGNVVFDAGREAAGKVAARIEEGMAAKLKVSARVTVLTGADFATVVEENPLGGMAANPSRLFVAFLSNPADGTRLKPLARQVWKPEALGLGSRAAYLWCPVGMIDSPLTEAVGRVLGDATTTRNWATVTKIRALL
ncbi:MAG TPA: DUF1697 domain-containing protein [Vicinamibacteria bacterium]|nr:DUF1697 domain-containing protein [Vicinamibacteria bacterium]